MDEVDIPADLESLEIYAFLGFTEATAAGLWNHYITPFRYISENENHTSGAFRTSGASGSVRKCQKVSGSVRKCQEVRKRQEQRLR